MPMRCPDDGNHLCERGCSNVCHRSASMTPTVDPWPICHVTRRECQLPDMCCRKGCANPLAINLGDRRIPMMADGSEWPEREAWHAAERAARAIPEPGAT